MGIGRPSWQEADSGSDDDRAARDGVPSVAELLARVADALAKSQGGAKDFFTTEEFGRLLGVTSRAVCQMMDRGELPWAKLGRHRLVVRAELLKQLAAQAQRNESRRWPA